MPLDANFATSMQDCLGSLDVPYFFPKDPTSSTFPSLDFSEAW